MPRMSVYVSQEVADVLAAQALALELSKQHYLRAILAAVAKEGVRMAPSRIEPPESDEPA